jgi:hypothetical protein
MKITNLKTVYICPDHNNKYHDRQIHMDTLLNKIGFKDIIHFKSSSEKYPTCLCKAIIDILKNNLDNPVLILEDDIEWTGITDIEFEPYVDAIYLGLSKSGGHPTNNIHLGDSIFQPWSETQVKVINMLSGHAILYNSRRYKEAVIDILSNNLNELYHSDVLYSRLQSKYIILANKKPVFYQSSKFNKTMHEENWTKFELNI